MLQFYTARDLLETLLTPDPSAKYFKGLRINAYANGSGLKGEVMHRLQASPTVYTPFYLTYLRTIPEGSSYE